jgi:hypothetical protein
MKKKIMTFKGTNKEFKKYLEENKEDFRHVK